FDKLGFWAPSPQGCVARPDARGSRGMWPAAHRLNACRETKALTSAAEPEEQLTHEGIELRTPSAGRREKRQGQAGLRLLDQQLRRASWPAEQRSCRNANAARFQPACTKAPIPRALLCRSADRPRVDRPHGVA